MKVNINNLDKALSAFRETNVNFPVIFMSKLTMDFFVGEQIQCDDNYIRHYKGIEVYLDNSQPYGMAEIKGE